MDLQDNADDDGDDGDGDGDGGGDGGDGGGDGGGARRRRDLLSRSDVSIEPLENDGVVKMIVLWLFLIFHWFYHTMLLHVTPTLYLKTFFYEAL